MHSVLAEVLRSSAFRIAGAYSILFVASLIASLSIIYLKAADELRGDLREKIEAETVRLLAIHRTNGTAGLAGAIERCFPCAFFYRLEDNAGKRLAGGLETATQAFGWYEVGVYDSPEERLDGDATTVQVLGTALVGGATLAVGASYEGIDDLREVISFASIWVVGLTALLALAGGLIIYRTSMRRVDMITRSSQAIMTGNLRHRLPLNGTGDELDRLSASINQMLERIEQLMAGMKQVTSSIAHDLRTPLGRLRQMLELAREEKRTDKACQAVFERAIAEMNSILETFDALLQIGKIEAGAAAQRFAKVNLSEMVAGLSESYRPVIEDNAQLLETSIETGVVVIGDRTLLIQMLVNLLGNAIHHCGPGTEISLNLSRNAEAARLTVADTGSGVPPEELPKIVQPFYRLEKSRPSNGSGLGLALVNAIAHLHGIHLELSDNAPGLKATLTFPNTRAESSSERRHR